MGNAVACRYDLIFVVVGCNRLRTRAMWCRTILAAECRMSVRLDILVLQFKMLDNFVDFTEDTQGQVGTYERPE